MHGDKLLKKINTNKNPFIKADCDDDEIAYWCDWRLILNGKKYKGKFKSFEDWQNYYN